MGTDQRDVSGGGAAVGVAARLVDALYRGMNAAVLYSLGHPAVSAASGEAEQALRELGGAGGEVRLGVTAETFLYKDELLAGGDAVRGLAGVLHGMDAAAIEFRGRCSVERVLSLVEGLVGAQKGLLRGGDLAAHVETVTGGVVRVVPLNYDGLRLAEGARPGVEGEGGSSGGVGWADVVRAVVGGVEDGLGVSGSELAGAANEAFAGSSEEAVGQVRGQLQALAQAAESLGACERAKTLGEVRDFVAGLDPGLRGAMLSVDPARPDASLALLGEMAERLPVHEVVDALRGAESGGHAVSNEAMRLFKRLAHVTAGDPDQNRRLQETAGKWRVMRDDSVGSVATSLEELMQMRSAEEFSPEDYQKRLDEVSKTVRRMETGEDYAGRLDAGLTKTHAVAIAVSLLEDGAAAEDRGAEILDYVSSSFDHLIGQKAFELVHSAVRAAKLFLGGQGDEGARRAAQKLLATLQSKERIHRIVELGCGPEGACGEALALLRAAGPVGLRHVTDLLGEGPAEYVRAALESVIRGSTGEQLHRVVRELEKGDAHASRTVVAMVRTVGSERGLPLLEPLLTNLDAEVRREAYRVLGEVGGVWPDRILRSGMGEEDPEIQAIVIDRLVRAPRDDEESLQIMGAYLEGTLNGQLPDGEHFMRVVEALGARGGAGVERLCGALRFLGRRPNPRNVVLVTRLAQALQAFRSESMVRRALLRWRVSPAYLLSVVLLGGGSGKGAEVGG